MVATVERAKPIVGPESLSEAWFELRARGIGSSEGAKAVGLSEWGTPLDVFAEKRGLKEGFAGNKHTKRGRRYEPLIAEDWQEITGRTLRKYPAPMYIHPDHPWMFATPDGEIDDSEGLEIKCPTFRQRHKFGEQGTDWLPDDYVIQSQWQMAVMGWERVNFAVLIDLGEDPLQFTVDRNDELIAGLIEAGRELWERIENNNPPEPDWNHKRTPDLVKAMYGLTEGRTIALTGDVGRLWEQQRELGEKIKAMEEEREVLRSKVLFAIGDAATAVIPEQGIELIRSQVKECQVSYTRKSYISLRERKAKAKR